MNNLIKYIKKVLDETIVVNQLPENEKAKLPLYISLTYNLYQTNLFGQELVLAQPVNAYGLSVAQTEKQLKNLHKTLHKKVILVPDKIASYNRARLINKKVNFIVPGKQLFLPALLMDLREGCFTNLMTSEKQNLIPSAQVIVLFHLLNPEKIWDIEKKSFKKIAVKLNYSPMAITKAVENLKELNLITTSGEKEKYIRFKYKNVELWNTIEENKLWISPVLKQIYVNEIPPGVKTWYCNMSALSEYSDMNRSRQNYLAVGRKIYNKLIKKNLLLNANPTEGKYCLEIWKYEPGILSEQGTAEIPVVDPLSLYFSLENISDERVEMALQQIKEQYIW